MKLLRDFLRDLALNCKQLVQITIVLVGPDVRVRAGVDQLRIHMKPVGDPADTPLQNVRYAEIITDLSHIPFVAISHYAGPADDFQVGDFRKLRQNVVLHTIDEGRSVFSLVAQVFKRQNGDSGCYLDAG